LKPRGVTPPVLTRFPSPAAEVVREREPRHEPAGVRHVGNAALICGLAGGCDRV